MRRPEWIPSFGAAKRAGILAAFAIALTGRPALAEEPTSPPAAAPSPPVVPASQTPMFTPVAHPAPANSAVPWLAQPAPTASFTAEGGHARTSRMMWLVLPAIALGGAALYLRLAKRRGGGPTVARRRLEVLDTTRVGPKAHVVMVSVGGRQLLLGVTEQSVQRIAWVGAEKQAEPAPAATTSEAKPAPASAPVPNGPFAHLLRSFTQGRAAANFDSDVALRIAAETKDIVERRTVPASDRERDEMLRETPKLKALPAHEGPTNPRAASTIEVLTGGRTAHASGDPNDFEEQVSGLKKRRPGKNG